MNLINWISNNSSFILAITTVVLAIITFFYLRETKLIRLVTEKSFKMEISPQVFVKNITSTTHLDSDRSRINVTPFIEVKNSGKTAAKNMNIPYKITVGSVQMTDTLGIISFLYPDQIIRIQMKGFHIGLKKSDLEIVKRAVKEKLKLQVPDNFVADTPMNLEISYDDNDGNRETIPYVFKYVFRNNSWVIAPKKK